MGFVCCYSTNRDNDNYLMVSVKDDFLKLSLLDHIPKNIKEVMSHMCYDLAKYELEYGLKYPKEKVALRKDSLLGSYMENHKEIFQNEDEDITYDKIVESYKIALFDEKEKMCNKLGLLFREEGLLIKGDPFIVSTTIYEYIKNNHDFWDHYYSKKGDDSFLVYKEGTYQRKVLKNIFNKGMVKK